MENITIEILCPKCNNKASFHTTYIGTYRLYPDKNGRTTCSHCGLNSAYIFTNKDYFYQIPIGKRLLYATNKEKLIDIKKYFENNLKAIDSNIDFPKEFYKKKDEIIKKINLIIQKETTDQ